MSQDNKLLGSIFEEDKELLTDIGRVVAVWGSVHELLRSLAAIRLGVSPDNTDILLKSFNGEGAKVEFLIWLISMQKSVEDDPLLQCLGILSDLTKERNIIIHGGPIKGSKKGEYEWGYHFVDYRKYKPDAKGRFKEAKTLVAQHLHKIRSAGSSLWNIVFEDEIKLLDDPDKWNF